MKCTPQKTIVRLLGGRRLAREAERVADVVGDVLDLGHLVVVGEDHGVAGLRRARAPRPGARRSPRSRAIGSGCEAGIGWVGAMGRFMAAPRGSGRGRGPARSASGPPSRSILPPSPRPPGASRGRRRRSPRARRGRATCATAARSRAGSMLSSSSRGAPAASACSISSSSRTSTSSRPGELGRRRPRPLDRRAIPPAAAMWFSLIRIAS